LVVIAILLVTRATEARFKMQILVTPNEKIGI